MFSFLASDKPSIDGNFGFKDVWTALLWIRENISAFGGDPNDVQVTGLSAGAPRFPLQFGYFTNAQSPLTGAHVVHQLLHYAAQLPEDQTAPFTSAMLQSNAILSVLPPVLTPSFLTSSSEPTPNLQPTYANSTPRSAPHSTSTRPPQPLSPLCATPPKPPPRISPSSSPPNRSARTGPSAALSAGPGGPTPPTPCPSNAPARSALPSARAA